MTKQMSKVVGRSLLKIWKSRSIKSLYVLKKTYYKMDLLVIDY